MRNLKSVVRRGGLPGLLPSIRHALVSATTLLAAGPGDSANSDDQAVRDRMLADCRAEGETGGLGGGELEAFVRDCVQDLLTVRIGNIDRQ